MSLQVRPKVMLAARDGAVASMFMNRGWEVVPQNAGIRPDLICFTGGEDVDPSFYNEPNIRSGSNIERDKREKKIFEEYRRTPKVGICRGGQFLNVMSGGRMWQDVKGHTRYHNATNLLTGDEIYVSSTHHQMMRPTEDAEHLMISKEGSNFLTGNELDKEEPDFDTEVVWYKGTNSLCFQPHPEYDTGDEDLKDTFFGYIQYLWDMSYNKKWKAL